MPLFVIHKLQIPFRRKVGVTATFSLGGICCCATAMRVHFLYKEKDSSVGPDRFEVFSRLSYLALFQLSTSISAASLPALCPVFLKAQAVTEPLLNDLHNLFNKIRSFITTTIPAIYRSDGNTGAETQSPMTRKEGDNRSLSYFDEEYEINRLYLSDNDRYISPPLPVRIKL